MENKGNEKSGGPYSGEQMQNEAMLPENKRKNQERIGTKYGVYRI